VGDTTYNKPLRKEEHHGINNLEFETSKSNPNTGEHIDLKHVGFV